MADWTKTLVTLAVVVVALQVIGVVDFSTFTTGGKAPAPTPAQIVADACSDPSNTMTVGPQYRRWSPSTSMSSENVYVWEIPYNSNTKAYSQDKYDANVALGSKTDSSTLTVNYKDKMAFLYGYASTTYWQSFVKDVVAPCGPFASGSLDSGAAQLISNGTITLNAFGSDSPGTKNDGIGTVNESIGSADIGRFDLDIETSDKVGFAATKDGKFLVIVEVNGTTYDEQDFTLDGKPPTGATPSFYTVLNTDSVTRAWEFNGCPAAGQTKCDVVFGELYVETGSGSEDPIGAGSTNAGAVGLGDIRITFIPADWYLDTKTYEPKYGYAKDDGTIASPLYGASGVSYFLNVN